MTSSSSGAADKTSVIAALRERTRTLHEQVEAGMDLAKSLSSRAAYRKLLEGYLGLYRPFEAALSEASDEVRALAVWPERARVRLLEQDLKALGASVAEIAVVNDSPDLPDLHMKDAILGALYVIEGSQLGGQYIFRQVQEKLRLDEKNGGAFFFGDGAKTSAQWKRFLAGLEEQTHDANVASDTASAMFGYFGRWLTESSGQQETR